MRRDTRNQLRSLRPYHHHFPATGCSLDSGDYRYLPCQNISKNRETGKQLKVNVCDTPELPKGLRVPENARKLATLPQRRTSVMPVRIKRKHQASGRLLRVTAARTKLDISPKRCADYRDLRNENVGAMLDKLPCLRCENACRQVRTVLENSTVCTKSMPNNLVGH